MGSVSTEMLGELEFAIFHFTQISENRGLFNSAPLKQRDLKVLTVIILK